MGALEIRLSNGATLAVPANLQCTTSFVLLEQERWFEKEVDFLSQWLEPGMTVIDIGANLGVYSLPIARSVAPAGRVFAYEPGSESRALLQRSRELNNAVNLDILPFALSDRRGEGWLVFGRSSEQNALGEGGVGEKVGLTTLDSEDVTRGWSSPDFVKVDAEGHEESILAGGQNFFARHSPLVMFEVGDGAKFDRRLPCLFLSAGYRLFRQLVGTPVLVPVGEHDAIDNFELNLFAAKRDRARALTKKCFLIDAIPAWRPDKDDRRKAVSFWASQKYGPNILDANVASANSDYLNGLVAYAIWRASDEPIAVRCGALVFALEALRAACASRPTAGRLSTLARVEWEWGAHSECNASVQRLAHHLVGGGAIILDEPFLPANARFETIPRNSETPTWFAGAVIEQFVRAAAHSSAFFDVNFSATPMLPWLCDQPFGIAEMERRRVLLAARASQRPQVPLRLRTAAPDHLNAKLWREGQVPGTVV